MTIVEKVEFTLIPVLGAIFWLLPIGLPEKPGSGRLLLVAAAILLFQGLIRDLWLLRKSKLSAKIDSPVRAQCICAESLIGITGVVVGIGLLGSGIDRPVSVSNGTWSLLVMAILTMGYGIKDYVIELNPLRIRRDKDHLNLVFSWKR